MNTCTFAKYINANAFIYVAHIFKYCEELILTDCRLIKTSADG